MIIIIQAIIFTLFVAFLMIKFKGPIHSISYSWYLLPKKWNFLFIIFAWSMGALMFLHETDGILFFLSGAGFIIVGAATQFKTSIVNELHYGGAAIGIGLALIGLGVEYDTWWPLIAFPIASVLLLFTKIKHKIWWVEVLAFAAIVLGFLIPVSFFSQFF